MSEFAEKCVQEMLPELNEMKKLGLFTADELSKILKKRRAHEYKIRRKTKELKTYLEYIEYEKAVLKLLKQRRQKMKCSLMIKEIEVFIFKRIHKLFQLASTRFPGSVDLWLRHIEFCIKRKEKLRIGALYTRALKLHPHNENLWIMAAKYEMDENRSMEGARNLLQRSLRMNPKCKHLYREYFRMELLNSEKIRLRAAVLSISEQETQESKSIQNGTVALVVLENAIKEIPGDVDFCLSFVEITRLFNFAEWIEDIIYEHLTTGHMFVNCEKAQASVACRNLLAVMIDLKNKKHTAPVEVVVRKSYTDFKSALEKINTEKMWELYLTYLMDTLKSPSLSKGACSQILTHARFACLEAADQNMLTENIAFVWIELLSDDSQKDISQKIAPMIAWKFPTNIEIWKSVFNLMTNSTDADVQVILDLLEECNKYMNKDSELVEIWKVVIGWLMAKGQDDMEKIFEISIGTGNRNLTKVLKEMYLDWAVLTKPIKYIRDLFTRLSKDLPFSSHLVKIYLRSEMSQEQIKYPLIKKTFDRALIEFGNSDIGLWLDYIKFETENVKESPENVKDIYHKAIRTLDPGLESGFIERYTLFKCGHVQEI